METIEQAHDAIVHYSKTLSSDSATLFFEGVGSGFTQKESQNIHRLIELNKPLPESCLKVGVNNYENQLLRIKEELKNLKEWSERPQSRKIQYSMQFAFQQLFIAVSRVYEF